MTIAQALLANVLVASGLAAIAYGSGIGGRRPAFVHAVWLLVLAKLVTPPIVSFPWPAAIAATNPCTEGTCACESCSRRGEAMASNATWTWTLGGAWAAGSIICLVAGARRQARFHRLLRYAVPAPRKWRHAADRLAARMGLRGRPAVLQVAARVPPLVVAGWNGPRIVVPAYLVGGLDAAERTTLLLHEIAHLKRRDHLVRYFELAVRAIYWWLPLVWLAARQLRAAEEACCDARVIETHPNGRRAYARLLLRTLDLFGPVRASIPLQATTMAGFARLRARLQAILFASPRARMSGMQWFAAGGLACMGMFPRFGEATAKPATAAPAPPATIAALEMGAECSSSPTAIPPIDAIFQCPSKATPDVQLPPNSPSESKP
jgi:beta-lactamase regulating signal transducer with metallopeptidase domain